MRVNLCVILWWFNGLETLEVTLMQFPGVDLCVGTVGRCVNLFILEFHVQSTSILVQLGWCSTDSMSRSPQRHAFARLGNWGGCVVPAEVDFAVIVVLCTLLR